MPAAGIHADLRAVKTTTAFGEHATTAIAMATRAIHGSWSVSSRPMQRGRVPSRGAGGDAEERGHGEACADDERGLPGDHDPKLTAGAPEHLEDGEVAAPPSGAGDQQMADHDETEQGEEARDRERHPTDLVEAPDLERLRGELDSGLRTEAFDARQSVEIARRRRGRIHAVAELDDEGEAQIVVGAARATHAHARDDRTVGDRLRIGDAHSTITRPTTR